MTPDDRPCPRSHNPLLEHKHACREILYYKGNDFLHVLKESDAKLTRIRKQGSVLNVVLSV